MSDIVELTPELINDPEKITNFFQTCDQKRKNKLLSLYFQAFFKGQIGYDKGLQFFRTLIVNEPQFTLLLDHIYLASQTLLAADASRKVFKQLLNSLNDRIPSTQRQQLFDFLDEETLIEAGLLNPEYFTKRKRQLNTQLNFLQSKNGMMRDENEGYSKLMVEILEASNHDMIDEGNETCIHNLISLIGYFDLDPDRCVDIIIESWIHSPHSLSYLAILRQFRQMSVAHFLGKWQPSFWYSADIPRECLPIPGDGLKGTTHEPRQDDSHGHQIQVENDFQKLQRLFEVQHIWKYLSPLDSDMEKTYMDKCDIAFRYYKSFDQLKAVDELNDQDNKGDRLKREVFEQYLYNQKLWLMQGLLSVNCFDVFKQLYYAIGGQIDFSNFHPLKKTLASFIDWVIEPIYKKICYSKHFQSRQVKSSSIQIDYDHKSSPCRQIRQYSEVNVEFLNILEELLQMFSAYLSEYPITISKLIRVLTEPGLEQFADKIEHIMMAILLPSMASRDCLPVVKMIWKFASQMDYRKRYIYYSRWKDESQFSSFQQVVRTGELAKCFLRQVFNKLDKDSKDKMTLKMAKITHSQPMLVMNELRRDRVQNSDNNPFMIHALNLMSGLSLDVLVFSVVQWLNDFNEEKKIRARDIECSLWFKNVGSFLGAFYRKYYSVEMQGLFAYICEGLVQPQEIKPELFVLKELIEKMTGIVQIEDLSQDQIQALAGGRYIQLETTHQTNDYRKSRKSNQALENFFWNTTIDSSKLINQENQEEQVSLAFLLFVILCQQRTKFLKYYQDQNLRPLSVVYDNFTWSINQLTKCLLFQTDKPIHYAQLFPKNPLYRMVIDFKIQFEIAFRIVRYGHKSLYNMSEVEFQEARDNIKDVFDRIDITQMYDNPDINNMEAVQLPFIAHTLIKNQVWESVNPDLFAIFWLLSVDNIYIPTQLYEKQVKQNQENLLKITDQKELARQQKSSNKALEKLQNELDNNKKRKEQFEKFLIEKKDFFKFKDKPEEYESFISTLCQLCILPRILIDPAEAMYCAKFIHTLLRISKPKYTYTFYIPRDIIYYTFTYLQCATEQESVNLSVFIMLLIQPFQNWNDELKFKSDLKFYFEFQDEQAKGYDKERSFIVGTIFYRMLQFLRLLKNNETQVRNAMIFLKNTQDIFPPTQQLAVMLKEYLTEVSDTYSHVQDIKVRIQTYKLAEKMSTLSNYICAAITNNPLAPPLQKPSELKTDIKSSEPKQELKQEPKPDIKSQEVPSKIPIKDSLRERPHVRDQKYERKDNRDRDREQVPDRDRNHSERERTERVNENRQEGGKNLSNDNRMEQQRSERIDDRASQRSINDHHGVDRGFEQQRQDGRTFDVNRERGDRGDRQEKERGEKERDQRGDNKERGERERGERGQQRDHEKDNKLETKDDRNDNDRLKKDGKKLIHDKLHERKDDKVDYNYDYQQGLKKMLKK